MNLDELATKYSVGFIAANNQHTFGSCFVAKLRDEVYLITDCHVLYFKRTTDLYDHCLSVRFTHQDSGPDDGVFLFLDITLADVKYDERLDIAYIKLTGLNEEKCKYVRGEFTDLSPLSLESFDLASCWGNDAYLIGFPHSIMLDSPFDSKPSLSRGVVSSIDANTGRYIVDIPSIYGLSGSPILSLSGNTIKLIGIVQKLYPFNAVWFSKNEPGINRSDWHNSGYTMCISSCQIKIFIENHEGAN